MDDPLLDLLALLRAAQLSIHRAGAALDAAHAAATTQLPDDDVLAMTDLQAWECHLLHARCVRLTEKAEHLTRGKCISPYVPVSGWLT